MMTPIQVDPLSSTPATALVYTIGSTFIKNWFVKRRNLLSSSPSTSMIEDYQNFTFFNYTNSTINMTLDTLDNDSNGIIPGVPPFPFWLSVIIAVLLIVVILVTVGGNLLVLLAFIVDRNIRQPSNYFIASLATTDMLIGTVSLPFFMDYVLKGFWHLGPLLCDLWLSVDYTVCLASQYTVLFITIDRFCSVKIAARYRAWRTKSKVLWMIAMTWLIPAALFFTTIFGWEHFVGYRDLQEGECAVQFLKDPVFNTTLIIVYYWITLFVLFFLYTGIFKTAYDMQKKSEAKQRKMQSMVALSAGAMSGMAGRAAGIPGLSQAISSEGQIKESLAHKETTSKGSLSAPLLTLGTSQDSNSSQKSSAYKSSTTATGTSTTFESDGIKKDDPIEIERSSSPAFDSDDEGSPQMTLKKRASIANLMMKTGAFQLFNNIRPNGGIMVKPIAPTLGDIDMPKSSLSQISEKSFLGPINIHELQNSDTQSPKSVFKACLTSPTPSEQYDISIVTTIAQKIVSPPTDFKGSPPVSESPTSMSDSSRARTLRVVRSDGTAYDILVNMDNSDLRYMEDSSIRIPSPTVVSPPSSMTFPLGTEPSSPPTLNSGSFPNTSLLQAALIRATEVKAQPLGKTPPVLTKANTEVTFITSEMPKPVTTLVSVHTNENINQMKSRQSPDGKLSLSKLKPLSSQELDHSEVSSPCGSSHADKNESKRAFVQNLGQKLKIKTSKKGILPGGGMQKSKSENRARKAFRTISFILGAFVVCWTPYHVLALVEGFCSDPPCINTHIYMFSYFLCYANSPINPFCYALANQQFKKTFARLLRGDFHMT